MDVRLAVWFRAVRSAGGAAWLFNTLVPCPVPAMAEFDNKIALVTGASRALGYAIVPGEVRETVEA